KKVPSNNYLLKCAIALTTDKEYKENLIEIQKRRRTKYINIQKGLKK
ncbi:DNA gyrase subunit A, partial [Clostridium botulinum]